MAASWIMPARIGMWGLFLGAFVGCRHGSPTSAETGASSYTVVEARRSEPAPQVIVGEVGEPSAAKYYEEFQQALPLKPLGLPVYPTRALRAKAGLATVGVNVKVD